MMLAVPATAGAVIPDPFVIAGGGTYPSTSPDLVTTAHEALDVSFAGLGAIASARYGDVYAVEPTTGRFVRIRENTEARDDGNAPQSRTVEASAAALATPSGIMGYPGEWLIADTGNHRIVEPAPIPSATLTTVVGTGVAGYADDTDALAASSATFTNPRQLARIGLAGPPSSFLVADDATVRKVTPGAVPTVETLAGKPGGGPLINGELATDTDLVGPLIDVSSGANETFYFIRPNVSGGGRVWWVDADGKIFSILNASTVQGLADGFLYAADGYIKRARQTFVGTGINGQPTTIAQPGVEVVDLVVGEDGLFFTTGTTVQFIAATSIAAGPADGEVVRSDSVKFEYGSWDTEATFACDMDYTGQGICPDEFPGLTDGLHHFEVRATTNANTVTDQTPHAARDFYVDTVAPTAPALSAPDAGVGMTTTRPEFTWAPSSDPQKDGYASGVDRYEVEIDGAVAATHDASDCSGTCTTSPAADMAPGSHTWRVRAIDQGGNATASAERSLVIHGAPAARLVVAPDRTLTGREVSFDASASDSGGTPITRYEWDLDGQPGFEVDGGTSPTAKKSYATPQTLTVGVRVTNGGGLSSTALATLTVSSPAAAVGPIGISINDGAQYTRSAKVTLAAAWPAFAASILASNDGGFGTAQTFALSARVPWTLDSSGPERLPKTVYVRYVNGLQTSETYTDDIILDETPPVVKRASFADGARASIARGPASIAAKRARRWSLRIRATDSNSGVAKLQITANKRKPGKLLVYRRTLKLRAKARPKFVRAHDRAGNFSRWRKLR